MLSNSKHYMVITPQLVDAQISRLSGLMFRSLRFPYELERRFESDTRRGRCRRLWLEGLLAIVVFNIVVWVGQVTDPEPDARAVILRLYWVTPLALAVNIGMLFTPSERLREGSIAMVTVTIGLTTLLLESNRNPLSAMIAQFGVAAVLVFGNSVIRLRFFTHSGRPPSLQLARSYMSLLTMCNQAAGEHSDWA